MTHPRRAKRPILLTAEELRWLLLTTGAAFVGGLLGYLAGSVFA